MAAGVTLQRMRRHVQFGRLGVWGAIAAGPLALVVAVLSPPTAVEAAAPRQPKRTAHTAPADPSGYAEVFLAGWLRSSAEEDTGAQERLVQAMAPEVELPEPEGDTQSKLDCVAAVRSAQRAGGQWSVTVAAQYADGSLRYFAVPVMASSRGASFAVAGVPGEVAGPAQATVPDSVYGVSVPAESELSSTVGEFLRTYLTGVGEVERYLAPGVKLSGLKASSYTDLEVEQVAAAEQAAAAEAVPQDGTKVRVLVHTEARDKAGKWPLAYELTLSARAGRWEIAGVESGTSSAAGGDRS